MGEEVPAHSGLLDVAGQDLGGLVRAGEKMEENVPRSKRAMPRGRGRVRLAPGHLREGQGRGDCRAALLFARGRAAVHAVAPSSDCEQFGAPAPSGR